MSIYPWLETGGTEYTLSWNNTGLLALNSSIRIQHFKRTVVSVWTGAKSFVNKFFSNTSKSIDNVAGNVNSWFLQKLPSLLIALKSIIHQKNLLRGPRP